MATLTIRDFPDKERDRLRRQAVASGRSMEAEARRLLLQGLAKPKRSKPDSGDWLKKVQALVARTTTPRPAKKLSAAESIARLQAFATKATKNRKSTKLLSEEFMEERRAMWGEE